MIKAVIFDVDNTLYSYTKAHEAAFDALAAYADRELGMSRPLFEELHQRTEHELRTYMGEVAALHNRCIRYQIMLENQGLPLYPHVLNMNGIYWDALLAAAVPSAGVTDAIRILKEKGLRIGIGTDMTARNQFKKLEVLGLLLYVDFLVSSEEAGAEKPEASFFARCVEKSGCRAEECLFVGDSMRKDVQGAMDAGLQAVWYRPDKPEDQTHVLQIMDMLQLPEVLSAL